MVKLFCAIVGVAGNAFSVRVDESDCVGDLKYAIKKKKPNDFKDIDADKLRLFLAKTKGGVWLDGAGAASVALDERGHPQGYLQMDPALWIKYPKHFGANFRPGEGQVHVLVVVPGHVRVDIGETASRALKYKRYRRWFVNAQCFAPVILAVITIIVLAVGENPTDEKGCLTAPDPLRQEKTDLTFGAGAQHQELTEHTCCFLLLKLSDNLNNRAQREPERRGNSVQAKIASHWTVSRKSCSPEQYDAEEWLFTFYLGKDRYYSAQCLRFSRWYLFFASFLVQFCIGSLYSWSVFNKPIDNHVYNNPKAGYAVNAFYTAVGVFGTTTAIMGPWIERNGPRYGVVLGTTSFLLGHVIVAIGVAHKTIAAVYVGYGLFCGFGMGLCYIAPVSALQKWFPDYRGTAAGFAVAGYGAGAVVWAKVYRPCIEAVGVSSTFLVVGSAMAATMYLCAIVLRTPHLEFTVGGLNIHGEMVDESELVTDSEDRGQATSKYPFESSASENEIDFIVSTNAQVVIVGTTPKLIRNNQYTAFVAEIFVLTASYGGGFGTIPAFLTDMFGAFNIGAMHGLILTAWSIGGVVGGITFNNAYSRKIAAGVSISDAYISTVNDIFIIIVVGLAVLLLVRTNPMDRFESGYHFSICGRRVISIKGKEERPKKAEPVLHII
ncbi:hypothetical protein ON010_g9057 [Phytophthora cinnamomi]|nr:hypothetical protein ON010_g9057 [Phytophthora cinnamomi]